MPDDIKARACAIEWDFRTDQATQCCEEAFASLQDGANDPGAIVGFQQPVRLTKGNIYPLSSYDVLKYGRNWASGVMIEEMAPPAFAAVSKAVVSSHLGNRDILLRSRIEAVTQGGWLSEMTVLRTVLRDMLIYTPSDIDAVLREMRSQPERYARQETLRFPGLCVIVLPPAASNHARALRMRQLLDSTQFARRLIECEELDLSAPLHIHPAS